MTFLYVLAALLMLGIMVMVHEAGHFFAARLTGIPVKEFAIGFGPKLISWKSKKHETDISLRLIPAGGFCAFYGEDDVEGKEIKDPRALQNFGVWKRMLTIIMGPAMNLIMAFVVCMVFYACTGVTSVTYGERAQIVEITADSPAETAGLQVGDIIETINGEDASGVNEQGQTVHVGEIIDAWQEGDAPLEIVVLRNEEKVTLSVTPNAEGKIGISMIPEELERKTVYLSIGQLFEASFDECTYLGGLIFSSLRDLVFGKAGVDQLSGPVGVVQTVAQQTQEYGITAYISLLIFISVNLGIVNLLPVPGLDGSRVIFLLIEAVCRKPVPQKIEAYIHLAGFFLLILLFIVLTWQDIGRIFGF